jgi:hypothetical protein
MASYYLPLTMPYINSRNAMIDIDGLKSSLNGLNEDIKERNRLKKNEMLGDRLAAGDLEGAEAMAFRNGDLDQGMTIRKHRQTERQTAQVSEKDAALRTAGYFQNYIQPEKDPLRKKALVTSWIRQTPNAEKELTAAGIDPEDYEGVTRFVIAEAQPFMDQKAQAELARINAARDSELAQAAKYRSEMEGVGDTDTTGFGMDEDGNIVRVENQVLGAGASQGGSTSYGTTGGTNFGQTGRETGDIPGVIVQDGGKAAPRWVSEEAQGQEAIANSPAEQQARLRRLQDTQRMWAKTYGKNPPAGFIYGPDGGLIDLKTANARGGSKTQQAAVGAIRAAADMIEDAREALTGTDVNGQPVEGGGTNMLQRGFETVLDTGTMGKVRGMMEPAVRAVMHGLSGAQVNIPETESYMRSFMPVWNDTPSRINFKLNQMKLMLTSIQAAIDGKQKGDAGSDAAIAQIRNNMRRSLGLPDRAPPPSAAAPIEGAAPGLESMSNEDLLRELER